MTRIVMLALLALSFPVAAQDVFLTNHSPQRFAESIGPANAMSLRLDAEMPTVPVEHTLLVLFTDAAIAQQGGFDVLKNKVEARITWLNQASVNSGIPLTTRVVEYMRSPMQESGSGIANTYTALTENLEVRALRDARYADQVLLMSYEGGGYTGYGGFFYWYSNNVWTRMEAHAVVKVNGGLNDMSTVAHEVGHMRGIDHNREHASSNISGAYHYGYRECVPLGFRDIMSYDCSNGTNPPMIQQFSTPLKFWNGLATGVDPVLDPARGADGARAQMDIAYKIAQFRDPPAEPPPPVGTKPAAPTSLTVTSTTGGAQLNWVGSSNTTSFRITRTTQHPKNGKWNQSTTFTVPGTFRNVVDTVPRGTYRYSIVAINAYGTSASSPVVQVVVS